MAQWQAGMAYDRLNQLIDNPSTPRWAKRLMGEIVDKDPVDVLDVLDVLREVWNDYVEQLTGIRLVD